MNERRSASTSRYIHKLYLQGLKSLNVILVTLPFAVCWYMYYAERIRSPYYFKGNLVLIALFAFVYQNMANMYDGLKISLYQKSEMIFSQTLGMLITDGIFYVFICILYKGFANLWPGIACIGGQLIMITIWSVLVHQWYFRRFRAQKSAIVYEMREGMDQIISEYGLSRKFDVKESFQVQECLKNMSILRDFQTIFLSGVHSHDRNSILKYCVEQDIDLYIIPRIGDVIMEGAEQLHLFHLPILRVGRYNPSAIYLFIKRLMDIFVSLIGLVLTSPIFLLTSIAVAADGGPVFYKQERLTKDGQIFRVIKFRSMRVDAEKDGVARLSTGNADDRITKVGRFIRKVRIDELPQLINILMGDMTLVGPRPERPSIAAAYEQELPEFRLRLQVKAGLTGYAQVYGKYNTTPYDKLVMDLMYISKPSLFEDIKLILATVKILFMPESTEGVSEGQTTALKGKENE